MKKILYKQIMRDAVTAALLIYGHYWNMYPLEAAIIAWVWLWPPLYAVVFQLLPADRKKTIITKMKQSEVHTDNKFFRSYSVFRIAAFCILLFLFKWYLTGIFFVTALWLTNKYIKNQVERIASQA